MVAGGNLEANSFFKSKGAQSQDASHKYTSRAAKVYLHQLDRKAKLVKLELESAIERKARVSLDGLDALVSELSVSAPVAPVEQPKRKPAPEPAVKTPIVKSRSKSPPVVVVKKKSNRTNASKLLTGMHQFVGLFLVRFRW